MRKVLTCPLVIDIPGAKTVHSAGPGWAEVALENDPENRYRVQAHQHEGRPLLFSITNLTYKEEKKS